MNSIAATSALDASSYSGGGDVIQIARPSCSRTNVRTSLPCAPCRGSLALGLIAVSTQGRRGEAFRNRHGSFAGGPAVSSIGAATFRMPREVRGWFLAPRASDSRNGQSFHDTPEIRFLDPYQRSRTSPVRGDTVASENRRARVSGRSVASPTGAYKKVRTRMPTQYLARWYIATPNGLTPSMAVLFLRD